MKRHASLARLSGDHHTALLLARALRDGLPEGAQSRLPEQGPARVAAVQERFERELAPHFAIEERELLPLSDCGPEALRACARRVREDHARLRRLVASLTVDGPPEQGATLGSLLDEHVRFEERRWFPALEAILDPSVLEALSRRLLAEPESLITGYHQDDAGVWVAELDCGHTQHVRHDPPWRTTPWVTSEAGRAGRLHSARVCPACRMPRMPPCARVYRTTGSFDAQTVPAGLLESHRLRAGTWGRIVVEVGHVSYRLEDEGDLCIVLRPGVPGTVAPQRPHRIEPAADAGLHVELLRCDPPAFD